MATEPSGTLQEDHVTDLSHLTAVTVRIAGEEHALRANADPEHTRACARFVDARIQEIREKSGLVETHRAAILAALSISDQFLRTREELERLRREAAERDDALAQQVEQLLAGG
jgi:cell division protein ZapA (FtsZ GTPase activity inhibitor)